MDRADMGEGRYANFAEIGHNAHEFVFDFGQGWPGGEPARVYVRVVTNPEMAQRLFGALSKALTEYRDSFGAILNNSDEDGQTA